MNCFVIRRKCGNGEIGNISLVFYSVFSGEKSERGHEFCFPLAKQGKAKLENEENEANE